jgi:hypothetical protein
VKLFVDTSTSWGIGFILDDHWLAWQLIPGWKADDRDIGWAEMIAVELALHSLIAAGFSNCHITLHSDNSSVVGSIQAGASRNSPQNSILRKIVSLMQSSSIWLSTIWVPSAENPADDPSHGSFPPPSQLFPYPPLIPTHLKPFVKPSVSFHDSILS